MCESVFMDFFKEWKEEKGIDIFTVDGIVCPKKYEKILFVMKDVNDAKNEGADKGYIYLTNNLVTRTDEGNTWFNVARWVYALSTGKPFNELPEVDHDFQHQEMKKSAVVNLKKEAGKSSVTDKTIADCIECYGDKTIEEIIECNPDIIIVCGVNIFNDFKKLFEKRVGNIEPATSKRPSFDMADNWKMGKVNINGKDVAVAQFRHPNRCNAEKSYNDMLKIRKYLLEK